jgi:hypothetical protein
MWGACSAFVLLTAAAMLAYPGGTFGNPQTRGYLFLENFFSDLGMTRSYSGAPNTLSMLLFVPAVFCAGGGLILFFARFGAPCPAPRWGCRIGSACGILAGICFFGIALTPQDLFSDVHDSFSVAAFLFLVLACWVYALVLVRAPAYPKKYALGFGVLAMLLCAYLALFLFGPPLTTRAGIVIQATGQKGLVYSALVALALQTRGALSHSNLN